MSGTIVEFGLRLPETWHVLPGVGDAEWAGTMAAEIAAGSSEPVAVDLLRRQLLDVRASVDAMGDVGRLRTAVLVDDVTAPLVSAMMTVGLMTGADTDIYKAQMEQVAHEVEDAQLMGNQLFDAEVSAGQVIGAHFLIGHMQDGLGDAGAHLEERVHAAVFPTGTTDALDVMVVAANVGLFEDLPTTVVDLLENVTLRTEGVA
jgi:hypothetical protein